MNPLFTILFSDFFLSSVIFFFGRLVAPHLVAPHLFANRFEDITVGKQVKRCFGFRSDVPNILSRRWLSSHLFGAICERWEKKILLVLLINSFLCAQLETENSQENVSEEKLSLVPDPAVVIDAIDDILIVSLCPGILAHFIRNPYNEIAFDTINY